MIDIYIYIYFFFFLESIIGLEEVTVIGNSTRSYSNDCNDSVIWKTTT